MLENVKKKESMMNDLKYQNYIFDLYGTLIDIHTDEEDPALWVKIAKKLLKDYGAEYTGPELRKQYLLFCKEEEEALQARNHAEYPEIKIEKVWARLINEKTFNSSENDNLLDKYDSKTVIPEELEPFCIYFREASRDKFCKYKDTDKLLSTLKNAGKKVYLLSNAQLFFTRKELMDADINKYFDDIFISSDLGIKKPQKEFMENLIKKHSLNKDECVMIGNEVLCDGGVAKANNVDSIIIKDGDFSKILG